MDPEKWGPHGWYFIESCVLNIDDSAKIPRYVEFLESLQHVLPCEGCRIKYTNYLLKNPIPGDKEGVQEWVRGLHNDVRKRCGKSEFSKKDIESFYSGNNNMVIFGAIMIILLILIIL
jgi:hypothetical protein